MNTPALITLDWGTSNLRASLLDQHANELDRTELQAIHDKITARVAA